MTGDAAEWFTETLYGGVEELNEGLGLVVWTLPDRITQVFGDLKQAARYATGVASVKDVYFGLSLIDPASIAGTTRRGELEDMRCITCLWADIDIAGDTHTEQTKRGPKPIPQSEAAAMEVIRRVGLKPSIIVHSGGGLHCYWLLKEPWHFNDSKQREEAQRFTMRWGATIKAVGKSMGYFFENLCDLPRVLRLPGTRNHKPGTDGVRRDRPVRVIEPPAHVSRVMLPQYAPDDFEMYFVAEELEEENNPVVTVDSLTLDPNACAPDDKLDALKSNNDNFKASWEMNRPDISDQSGSGYELSILTIAAAAGWTDQELANLSIHFRRIRNQSPQKCFRRQYLQKLIAKAKTPLERDRAFAKLAEEDVPGAAEKPLTDPDKRDERTDTLSKVLGISIARLIQEGEQHKDALYTLLLKDGRRINIGPTSNLANQNKFREAVFSVTGLYPVVKPKEWALVLKKLGSIKEVQENLEGDDVEMVTDYLKSYLRTQSDVVNSETWQENFRNSKPFIYQGVLYIHQPSFLRYINRTLNDPVQKNELWTKLRAAGFRNKKLSVRVGGRPYNKTLWCITEKDIDVSSLIVPDSSANDGVIGEDGGGDEEANDTPLLT